jgi:hypothetical protein
MTTPFQDFLKRDISIGDHVVFPGPYNSGMKLGQVVKYSKQSIRVQWSRKYFSGRVAHEETYRDPKECVRVEGADLTMYLLSGDY